MDGMSGEDRLQHTLDLGYEVFSRERWAALAQRSDTVLSDDAVRALAAMGEPISIDEVKDVYLPLAQLLVLIARNERDARQKINAFLGEDRVDTPFIIGVAGGVGIGTSKTEKGPPVLLANADEGRTVDLLTTDGFLWPNATLEARGIMDRKGFPESYDQRRLVETVAAVRAGETQVMTPVYSHLSYDVVPGELRSIRQPDILIVEGLNVLQATTTESSPTQSQVSDSFDVSIYVDAAETDVARWFHQRLGTLIRAPNIPGSFFHGLTSLSDVEVTALADQVWEQVNLVNLRKNVAPTRGRANLIVEKGSNHLIERILLRRP
jgi:type I pantothenate kinase